MMKHLKKFSWISVIMLQSFLGICAGMLILSSIKVDAVRANARVGELPVGDLSFEEAEALLIDFYNQQTASGALIIEIDQKAYSLSYSDLDVSVDIDKTVESLKKSVPQNALKQLFSDVEKELHIQPVFTYNSGKLTARCETLFSSFEKAAIAEQYKVENGILKFTPQIPGRKMDYIRLEQELKELFFVQNQQPYRIDTKSASLFKEVKAEGLYKEPFTALVSQAKIPLDKGTPEKIQEDLKAMDGTVFEKGQEINLKTLIDFSRYTSDVEKDSLNRLASALYQAALPIDGIKVLNRKPAQRPVTYTDSGLEAVIGGEGANLLMKNETERPLMLLAEMTNDGIVMYMASTGELKSGILIVQKKDEVPPPVITEVNKALSPRETRVVSEGIPGFTAYVSRIIDDERVELNHDEYRPVSKIVEVGEKPILTSSK